MSKRCPECRFMNDDSRLFCSACGASLDAHVRLIQNLEKQRENSRKESEKPEHSEIKFYNNSKPAPKKESSPLPWIILGAVVLAAIVWFLLP